MRVCLKNGMEPRIEAEGGRGRDPLNTSTSGGRWFANNEDEGREGKIEIVVYI